MQRGVVLLVGVLAGPALEAQVAPQTDADHYTRYELLAPGSGKFRILYEVTATTAGATAYYNPIRKGSVASDEAVYDRATGAPLAFAVVSGSEARRGGVARADTTGEYIKVTLLRPVPAGGEQRILIDKTYYDPPSYRSEGEVITYDRPLGIKKNAIVLPAGYEPIAVNYPSQIVTEKDGRIALSFMNVGPDQVPYVVRARKLGSGVARTARVEGSEASPAPAGASAPPVPRPATSAATPPMPDIGGIPLRADPRLSQRAHQDREIVYFLQPPQTHAFDLYHDYTESRPGIDKYVNVVRAGSRVSKPGAMILDTGERLGFEIMKGDAITTAAIDIGEAVKAETEIVVVRFAPVQAGRSVRLRLSETYTDSARYRMEGEELVWDRAFGRPANAMVLPAGWALANCSIPTTVSETADGRIRLDFVNPRNDEIAVLVTARRR